MVFFQNDADAKRLQAANLIRQAEALKEEANKLDGNARSRQTARSRDWPKVRRNPANPDDRCKPYDRVTGSGDRGGRGGRRGRRGGKRGGSGGGITISFGAGSKCWQRF